ncbi:hypothetical protein ACF3OC_08505 [Sphingobacterium cellulitidis]|uniref:hypothetical protein n=1 Tax=Sphingobacterium cellulitidis TaxID=1768011 RepID=UPI000B942694|nr:hypothetical protein CHT99_10410 [Sphingobacterium cellulitidis]
MSKTIEEIKDEVAIEYGWKSWKSCYGDDGITNAMIDEVAERYAQSQTQELQDWKESASKVFKNLDLQAIGKTLGIGLGEDVSTNVLPKINELQEQNAELVNALHVIKNLQSLIEYPKDTPIEHSGEAEAIHQMFNVIDILLTKYNHLKSNTNG